MTKNQGYIVEFIQTGGHLKVTAVDPETGTEATIIGDPKASRQELADLAARKLVYILNKSEAADQDNRPGIIV
ncbi:hypothetical protein GCM10007972_25240 [Iodidimonas muriae]|uniref:DUF6898 domain-containing protein n=1 Tax=Iodidimonas muriae TaxID=261467 RepID=A0ABQ2LG05_9PROT|nr:hypothetical protein [Iodidimonas muriae]GER08314.1 hypothetical protein JCM17843_26240 [Kordiimonadales bacterium JCM 17843]GGO16325.1 hypothetical protein GCM10007972_25240 [Iodidimonas muriae]